MNNEQIGIKSEEGNAVIEATFAVTVCLVFLTFIIMFGLLFYQETLLQSIANETATDIARSYTYKKKDPITGYIGNKNLRDLNLFEAAYFLTGSQNTEAELKGEKLAEALNNKERLLQGSKFKADVTIQRNQSTWFQNEVCVTVSNEYKIPLLSFIGMDGNKGIKREYVGRAICYDPVGSKGYYNMICVMAKNAGSQKIFKKVTKIIDMLENVAGTGANIFGFIKELTGWE